MGPVGRVPSNFGEPGDQANLVLSKFCDCHFCWAGRVTSEALQLFISCLYTQESSGFRLRVKESVA